MHLQNVLERVSSVFGGIGNPAAGTTLFFFEKYVNGAIIQWERIQRDKSMLPGPGPGVDAELIQTLFLDIHFYLICYDKAQNLLCRFVDLEEDQELEKIWGKYRLLFKPYNDARNHLEHVDERIERGRLYDLGNLSNDTFTFWGEKFDISLTGLNLLVRAYNEAIDLLNQRAFSMPQ